MPSTERSQTAAHLALSFDVGGTFTDFTLVDLTTGRVAAVHKVPTDPHDPARSSLQGWNDLVADGRLDPAALTMVVHATTLVTNAIIERKGARTAFLTTRGHRDLLTFGRDQMYDIYDLFARPAEPLAPREWRVEADERVARDGTVLTAIDPAQVVAALRPLVEQGANAVAIGFLHAFANPEHEERAAAALTEAFPEIELSLSSRVAPLIGEYERFSTTVADAYVKGRVRSSIGGLATTLHDSGMPAGIDLQIMLSAGGIATAGEAVERPIRMLESGPAAGALVAAFHGALAGRDRVLSLDMGGTTAKACLIDGGRPSLASSLEAARVHRFKSGSGIPISIPVVDLIEIGAGGGSIARIDELGLLKVGPDSAAADPGPACYGRGGHEATVTDANLLLGYLAESSFLGGRMRLDTAAAEAALARLGGKIGLNAVETAWGIHRIANEAMASAARIHAIERNKDPRRYTLLAFGGAGPAHAMAVAALLEIDEVIFPAEAGVASALGCLVAPPSISLSRTFVGQLDRIEFARVEALCGLMEDEARAALRAAGVADDDMTIERSVDLRLAGQYHELTVGWDLAAAGGSVVTLSDAFASAYEERYGRMLSGLPVEATTWRIEARGPEGRVRLLPRPLAGPDPGEARLGRRPVAVGKDLPRFVDAPVYARERLQPGAVISGPAILEEPAATAVLLEGDRGTVNEYGALVVQRGVGI